MKNIVKEEINKEMKKYNFNSARGWVAGFLTTIVFLILKLCKAITWKWFWVFSPIIFVAAVYPTLLLLILIIIILFA